MLYYLANTTDELQKEEIIIFFEKLPEGEHIKENCMTLARQWINEGMEKGIEKGIEKGQRMKSLTLAKKLLFLKFGDQSSGFEGFLDLCSEEDLDLIHERILLNQNIKEIFKDLKSGVIS